MAIKYAHLRSLTAHELTSALAETVLFWIGRQARINSTFILTGGG
jgi:hypothetical protein